MKWFKHISDSLDDPFISDLIDRFEEFGYLAFFGIIEIYGREFKIAEDWKLNVSLHFIRDKIKQRNTMKLKRFLNDELMNKKWIITIYKRLEQERVEIYIPKFLELIDDTTKKKIKEYEAKFQKDSGMNLPKEEEEEEEEEEERDITPHCPQKKIIALYHKTLPSLPNIEVWPESSEKQLRMRWRENPKRQHIAVQ